MAYGGQEYIIIYFAPLPTILSDKRRHYIADGEYVRAMAFYLDKNEQYVHVSF